MRKPIVLPIIATMLVALTSTIGASGVSGAYTCSSSSSCLSANQSAPSGSSGTAIKGVATNSFGIRGVSTNDVGTIGQTAANTVFEPGIEGETTASPSPSNANDLAGGFGLTGAIGGHAAAYGVGSIGLDGGAFGENLPTSNNGSYGMAGFDQTGVAVGLFGASLLSSGGTGGIGVEGSVSGDTTYPGVGVLGMSGSTLNEQNSLAAYGGYFAADGSTSAPQYGIGSESSVEAGVFANTTASTTTDVGNQTYFLYGSNGSNSIALANNGNVTATGTVTAAGFTSAGEAMYQQRGASGSTFAAYGTRAAVPELEDSGDAQLVNGRAIVHIDQRLADVMDSKSVYHVFLTPGGDCKGLYVTQKTPTSFVVAELQGGRSTLSFDYRIVAKPYGHTAERLAVVRPAAPPARTVAASIEHRFTHKKIVSPIGTLRASLGASRFARLAAEKRAQLNQR